MKKIILLAAALVVMSAFLYGQEAPDDLMLEERTAETPEQREKEKGESRRGGLPISLGLGLEVNNNNRDGAALGFTAAADYRLLSFLALGLRGGFSSNFDFSNTVEGAAFLRFVLPLKGLELFAQGGGGLSWIFIYEGNSPHPLFEGGAGVRLPLGNFYIEAAGRGGVPFLWGAGISAGYRFGG
jgi:hypothetical protein